MASELLCTVADVLLDWPGFSSVAVDQQTKLIAVASQRILDFCRRGFAEAAYDEFHDGGNTGVLWLKQKPVISIQTVIVDTVIQDNSQGQAWCLISGTGELRRGPGIGDKRFYWFWPRGTNNIEIQYMAGYATVPDPVNMAAVYMVRYLSNVGKLAGAMYSAESIGDYSYTLNPNALTMGMPDYVASLLANYVQDDCLV
jgi:hypothetical protein